jgi:hypothetical protein
MKAIKLVDLPIPQSGCGKTQIRSDGVSMSLDFEYRKEGRDGIGTVRFKGLIAQRYRDELHSVGYVQESYESIAEIQNSPWCAELKFDGRHFAIFLSSNGYFEVLAQEYMLEEPKEGLLE